MKTTTLFKITLVTILTGEARSAQICSTNDPTHCWDDSLDFSGETELTKWTNLKFVAEASANGDAFTALTDDDIWSSYTLLQGATQEISISFPTVQTVGAYLLHLNPTAATSGVITTEVLDHNGAAAACHTQPALDGGVHNCNQSGWTFRVRCSTSCSPALTVQMLKLWTIKHIGWFASNHYLLSGNTLSAASGAAQNLSKLYSSGSVLDLDNVAPGEAFTIDKGTHTQGEGFVLEFPNTMILKKVIVITQGDQINKLKFRYSQYEFFLPYSIDAQRSETIFDTDATTFSTYVNIDTTDEPSFKHLGITREYYYGDSTTLPLTKVIVFGENCLTQTPTAPSHGLTRGG